MRTVLGHHDQLNCRLGRIYRAWVLRCHFSMLNDRVRNQAFAPAIAQLNLRDKVVLDIGAGSGLLSMLAAKHCAAHVYACEMIAPIADKPVEIIAKNGYATRLASSGVEVDLLAYALLLVRARHPGSIWTEGSLSPYHNNCTSADNS